MFDCICKWDILFAFVCVVLKIVLCLMLIKLNCERNLTVNHMLFITSNKFHTKTHFEKKIRKYQITKYKFIVPPLVLQKKLFHILNKCFCCWQSLTIILSIFVLF